MDFLHNPEQRGEVPAPDNPQQQPSIEATEQGTASLNTVSRNFAVLPSPAAPKTAPAAHPLPLWLRRIMLFIFVAFAVELGMFLVVVPWYDSGRLWSENSLLLRFPSLRAFLAQDFIRGLVSGVGLVDIWVGIWEAVHYKESLHH